MFKINFEGSEALEFESPITIYEAAKSANLVDRSTLAVKIGDDGRQLDCKLSELLPEAFSGDALE